MSRIIFAIADALSRTAGALGSSIEVVARRAEPVPTIFRKQSRYRRFKDRVRVERVAGPGGFRWHVKYDGETTSSHASKAAADAAAAEIARKRHQR